MASRAAEAGPSRVTAPRINTPNGKLTSTFVRRVKAGEARETGRDEDVESGAEASRSEGELEDDESTDEEYQDALSTRRHLKAKGPAFASGSPRSGSPASAEKGSSWMDLDLSIIVALVSPIGNWLTGGDHIKNVFLIVLLIFYLHQIIEIPWQLYLASRPRKSGRRLPPSHSAEDEEKIAYLSALAQGELRRHEVFYLSLSIFSPFVGAIFLRHVLAALGDGNSLSWFSITLFVLATGIRPWTHLIGRLKDRTHELHTALHYPDEESLIHLYEKTDYALHKALKRIDALEEETHDLREAVKRLELFRGVCDDLSEAVGEVERAGRRSERKSDAHRVTQNVRLSALEKGLAQLEERRRRDVAAFKAAGIHIPDGDEFFRQAQDTLRIIVDKALALPRAFIQLGLEDPPHDTKGKSLNGHHEESSTNGTPDGNGVSLSPPRIRSPDREKHLPHLVPRLATIPEAEDSDSDGTFVSEKDHPTGSPPLSSHSPPHLSSSRSVSASDLTAVHMEEPKRVSAFEFAQNVALWPYRFSARVLVAVVPPARHFLSLL